MGYTSYLPAEHLCYLGEDLQYKDVVQLEQPTLFFRPDCRVDETHPAYLHADENGLSYIAFIAEYGSHETKTPPVIDSKIPFTISARVCKLVSELTDTEIASAYSFLSSVEEVVHWLQEKYPKQHFDSQSLITVYKIAYV